MRYGEINGGSGIAIVSKTPPLAGSGDASAINSLANAIGGSLGLSAVAFSLRTDSSLPEGMLVIFIGQKQ